MRMPDAGISRTSCPTSVHAEPILAANGLDWAFCLKDHPDYSLAKFTAGLARSRELPVVPKPLEGDPAHTEVHGNKSPSKQKALRDGSVWVQLNRAA